MSTLANSEDPDEMPQNAAFHRDLHFLLRKFEPWLDRVLINWYATIIY